MASHSGMSLGLDTADDYALLNLNHQHGIDNEDSLSCPSSPSYCGPNTPASARTSLGCSSLREKSATSSNFDIGFTANMHTDISGLTSVFSSLADYFPEALRSSYGSSPVFFHDGLATPSAVKSSTSGGIITAHLAPPMGGAYCQWNQHPHQSNNADPYGLGKVPLAKSHPTPALVASARSSPRMHITSSVWCHDNAPINFGFNNSPIKQEPIDHHQRSLHIRRRVQLSAVQERTIALRNMSKSHKASRVSTSHIRKESKIMDTLVSVNGVNIPASKIPESKSRCIFPNCNKVFRRQEHRNRHLKSVHYKGLENGGGITRRCRFCLEQGVAAKEFHGREDNYRAHVFKHCIKNANGRVKYHPDAQAHYDELLRQVKPRKAGSTGRSGKGRALKQEDMDFEDF